MIPAVERFGGPELGMYSLTNLQGCRADRFQSPQPSRTHRKKHLRILTESPYPRNRRNPPCLTPTPCVFSLEMHFLNKLKHICAVHVAVLLCVFSNDNEGKMPVKQITDWTVFGEIQTATKTFIACLTPFLVNLTSIRKSPQNSHRPKMG